MLNTKKSESTVFFGKERATLDLTISTIADHITITACGTFTSEEIVSTTVGMAMKRYSPTAFVKFPTKNFHQQQRFGHVLILSDTTSY